MVLAQCPHHCWHWGGKHAVGWWWPGFCWWRVLKEPNHCNTVCSAWVTKFLIWPVPSASDHCGQKVWYFYQLHLQFAHHLIRGKQGWALVSHSLLGCPSLSLWWTDFILCAKFVASHTLFLHFSTLPICITLISTLLHLCCYLLRQNRGVYQSWKDYTTHTAEGNGKAPQRRNKRAVWLGHLFHVPLPDR